MDNNMIVVEEKKVKKSENKVCAILYTITTVLWMITVGIKISGIISYGDKMDWSFWMDVALVVVFGSIAVEYFIKLRKERKAIQ